MKKIDWCYNNLYTRIHVPYFSTDFCPRRWDGWSCWDDTRQGQSVFGECPSFIEHAVGTGCKSSPFKNADKSSFLFFFIYNFIYNGFCCVKFQSILRRNVWQTQLGLRKNTESGPTTLHVSINRYNIFCCCNLTSYYPE